MHCKDNFAILTQPQRDQFTARKTSNIHYVCNAYQRTIEAHWGCSTQWINPDILTFLDEAYHEYCGHQFYPSTLANLMVDWSVQHDYGEKDRLYIAFTEHLIEAHPVSPQKWGFYTKSSWCNPFDNEIFSIKKAITHYLEALNMTPLHYLDKYPDTALRHELIYKMSENL